MPAPRTLELLAPARNADLGIEAIRHGADAVYIGGPAFGARMAAGNSIEEIARLVAFAHRFHARVLVALNTLLRDDELEPARVIAWRAFEAGADALIVQDMGLLQLDLPPIALHASTQTDNRSVDKVRFLEQVGFSQIVLARELSLGEIREIAASTGAVLEFFVHGALCVSYSGQCYISHAHTGRSANRGECSQACRLPYTLTGADGTVIARDKHLLSLKDNDQSANLAELAEAGVRSFKIEGRLKDLSYVKNVTAHYRQRLDALIEADPRFARASSGHTRHSFAPRPEKTFNRGATDYFVHSRRADIGAFDSPTWVGEPVGRVRRIGRDRIELALTQPIGNGDGLCWYDHDGRLVGLRVNRADGDHVWPQRMPAGLAPGTELFRNHDQAFERVLSKPSAQRRIAVDMRLEITADRITLALCDEDRVTAGVTAVGGFPPARDPDGVAAALREQLARLGNTDFSAREVSVSADPPRFVPTATINALRRDAAAALIAARLAAHPRPPRLGPTAPPAQYPATELSYLGNVLNAKARAFYERHGVRLIASAYEADLEPGEVSLMITRHCLRYSFNLCPKQVKGIRPDPLRLVHGRDTLSLRFDCKRCEMHVIGARRTQHFPASAIPIAIHRRSPGQQIGGVE